MRISSVSWFSFILCYWVSISINISLLSGHCLEDQKLLLLQLKNTLNFDSAISTKLVLWNEDVPCCDWNGVTCDEEGHVTGLDLSYESISGGFDNASTLFSLQYMQNLNLANNNFYSGILSEIIKLKNLTCLNFSNAGFREQIPMEIGQLTRLVILDLSDNYYLELENPNLVKLVQNLTEIRELYLDEIDVSLEGKEWGQALSSSLPHLQVLSMYRCNLSGPIDSSLQTLKNLSVISLEGNDLYGPVPKWFANFSKLTNLNLASCGFTGKFPKEIFQVQSLSSLDLSNNEGLKVSFPYFAKNGSLRELILSSTSFLGGVPDSISNLRHLSRLEISSCFLNGTISSSLSNLEELTYLDLSLNNFTGPIPLFRMAKKLTFIDLSNNQFSGGISSAHFKALNELVSLKLGDNLLNGSIPTSLFALPLLQSISLYDNNFQGQLKGISLNSSSVLELLDLGSNKLEGSIPDIIFLLKRLSWLDLSSNKFKGTIELDMISRLENLEYLNLSYNNLSIDSNVKDSHLSSFPKTMTDVSLASCKLKEIPRFLRNQSRLLRLDLSNNQISRTIPKWIWQLGFLTLLNLSHNSFMMLESPQPNVSLSLYYIDLHDNNLQGPLPPFPKGALYLDYSSNNFSSVVPPNIGNHMWDVEFLSLSHNFLRQRIPDSICNAANLLVLDLSYNKFDGMIPSCLVEISPLRALNLRANNLTGEIPDEFLGSWDLRTLDLNGNNFEGEIPKSLSYCTSLEVLDLGNNKMNDTFPCFLNNVSTLQILVLRKNNFHGTIGCPNNTKIWNKLQIVDLAFNNFNGILQGKLFTMWKTMMHDEHQATSVLKHLQVDLGLYYRTSDSLYYPDQVIITSKGLEVTLTKILTIFTLLDFSSNQFEGPIPKEMMDFKSLYGLNLSNNAFSGQIPSSIGNLEQLEFLDLSRNSLTGEIPTQLATLSFLEFLNVSFNHLEGKIPTGTQIQTFEAASFIGNPGLCGPPLSRNCSELIDSPEVAHHTNSRFEFEWKFVFPGVVFGLGIIIGPLFYKKEWRIWYWNFVDNILCSIFPQLYHEFQTHDGQMYKVLRWSH